MKFVHLLLLAAGALVAQVPNPTTQQPAAPAGNNGQPMPIFRVTVVSRTTKAVNYHHRTGTTHIDFRGTEMMPAARGEASVDSQMGSTKIDTRLNHMTPPSQFGPEYMTYVMWAITPEGRPANLGEVVLEGDHAKLLSTTELQAFGLIVTAEPYFAVTQPSDVVVAENFLRTDTAGTIEQVDAKYELLQRGQYVWNRGQYQPVKVNPKGPLQLAEAENAVEIARLAGAERYASDTFQKAVVELRNAEGFLNGGKNRKESETNAREAAQMAEDARIITIRKMREEELANERAAAAAARSRCPGAGRALCRAGQARPGTPRRRRSRSPGGRSGAHAGGAGAGGSPEGRRSGRAGEGRRGRRARLRPRSAGSRPGPTPNACARPLSRPKPRRPSFARGCASSSTPSWKRVRPRAASSSTSTTCCSTSTSTR